MLNEKSRKELLAAIISQDEDYKNDKEAQERLADSLYEVEMMQKGLIPKKSARQFLKELREENNK